MKTILLIIACIFTAFPAINRWKLAGDWVNPRADTDSLVMDSGVVDWVLDGNEVCESFTRLQGYGGGIDLSGDTLTVTGSTFYTDAVYGQGYTSGPGCIDIAGDATVTLTNRNYNGIYQIGAIAWFFRGDNTINQPQYGIAPIRLDWCYPGKTVTVVGGGVPGYNYISSRAGHPSIVYHGGELSNDALLQSIPYGNEPAWVGDPGTITGTGKIYAMVTSGAYRVTVPKLKTTNSFYAYAASSSSGGSMTFGDTLQCGLLNLYTETGNSIYFNGCRIVASSIVTEPASASGNFYLVSPSVYTRAVTLALTASGRFDMDGMTMTCHGNWTNTSAAGTVYPAGSDITFDTTCTVTSGTGRFDIVRLSNPTGTTITAADTVRVRLLYDIGSGSRAGVWQYCGISSLFPQWGGPGDTITAIGTYSGVTVTANVGGLPAEVVSKTDSTVRFIVPDGISDEKNTVIISQTGMADTLWYGFCCTECQPDSIRPFRNYVNQYPPSVMSEDIYGYDFGSYVAGESYVIINSATRSDTLRNPALWTNTHITDTLLAVIPKGPKSVQVRRSDGTVSTVSSRDDSLYLYKLRNK